MDDSGWLDSDPGDRRFILSTGPFFMDPGQSKVLFFAALAAGGSDRLSSISALRAQADEIQFLFESGAVMGSTVHHVASREISANATQELDAVADANLSIIMTGGDEDLTLEAASYSGTPLGLAPLVNADLTGVGYFQDIQVIGENQWPVRIYLYYTDQDLIDAGITEDELVGAFYWSGRENRWIDYSNSGEDDQGRGLSSVIKVTSDVVVDGTQYSGYVGVLAYHLDPVVLAGELETTATDEAEVESLPTVFTLEQNYPNPFNPNTHIRYGLPETADVDLVVYDITGRRVRTLYSGSQVKGWYNLEWDGTDEQGQPLGAGAYFARIQAGSFTEVIKMVFLK